MAYFFSLCPHFFSHRGIMAYFSSLCPDFFEHRGIMAYFSSLYPHFFSYRGIVAYFSSLCPHFFSHRGMVLLFRLSCPNSLARQGIAACTFQLYPHHSKYPLTFNSFSSVPTACSARSSRIVIAPTSSVLYTIVSTSCKRSNVSSCGCP